MTPKKGQTYVANGYIFRVDFVHPDKSGVVMVYFVRWGKDDPQDPQDRLGSPGRIALAEWRELMKEAMQP